MVVMFGSTRAGAVIIGWGVLLLLSIAAIPFHIAFAGVVIGALLTAGALALVVKWSVEDMFGEVTDDLDQMNDALADHEMQPVDE
jgi:hypothetical protein